jgi:hypothetical protein
VACADPLLSPAATVLSKPSCRGREFSSGHSAFVRVRSASGSRISTSARIRACARGPVASSSRPALEGGRGRSRFRNGHGIAEFS